MLNLFAPEQGLNLAHFVGNGTKVKIPSEIEQTLGTLWFLINTHGRFIYVEAFSHVKFIYSEKKPTKFCEISTVDLTVTT